MRCDVLVFWDATIFCNNFARWLQKIVVTCDAMQSTESPILFRSCPHCGHETPFFWPKMRRHKSGIPCSDAMCWFFWDATTCWFFWDAMFFCNNFARLCSPWRLHPNDDNVAQARARNPRFYFVHVSTKPRFLTKKRHQKSGIPCSGPSPWIFHQNNDNVVQVRRRFVQKRGRVAYGGLTSVLVTVVLVLVTCHRDTVFTSLHVPLYKYARVSRANVQEARRASTYRHINRIQNHNPVGVWQGLGRDLVAAS